MLEYVAGFIFNELMYRWLSFAIFCRETGNFYEVYTEEDVIEAAAI
jgi:hypothetical protein